MGLLWASFFGTRRRWHKETKTWTMRCTGPSTSSRGKRGQKRTTVWSTKLTQPSSGSSASFAPHREERQGKEDWMPFINRACAFRMVAPPTRSPSPFCLRLPPAAIRRVPALFLPLRGKSRNSKFPYPIKRPRTCMTPSASFSASLSSSLSLLSHLAFPLQFLNSSRNNSDLLYISSCDMLTSNNLANYIPCGMKMKER